MRYFKCLRHKRQQLEMKEEGIRKPKVIAFKDGTKIEVEEALELVKNSN